MDTTLSQNAAEPAREDGSPVSDRLARAEDALSKQVKDAPRADSNVWPVAGSDFSAEPRAAAPSVDAELHPTSRDRAALSGSRTKRPGRTMLRFLSAACVGVAATLAWQSYGAAARQTVASSVPGLGWLASPARSEPSPASSPAATPAATTASADSAPTQTSTANTSPQSVASAQSTPVPGDLAQQIKTTAVNVAVLRQGIEQIAAKQEQMGRTIARLQTMVDEVKNGLAGRAPLPARKPAAKPPQPAPLALAPGPRPLWESVAPPPPAQRPAQGMP